MCALSKSEGAKLKAPCAKEECQAYMNAMEELAETKRLTKKLDAVLESSYDGIYITDGNAVTTRINKAYERITGISSSEVLGKPVSVLVEQGIISKACSTEVLKSRTVVTMHQKLSSGKILLVTGTPIFDDHGEIEMVVTNVRDITSLLRMREELYDREKKTEGYGIHSPNVSNQLNRNQNILSQDAKMGRVVETAQRMANHDAPVLLTGETGVGKESLAEYIHQNSPRKSKSFVRVNCAAIPDVLIESELFGSVDQPLSESKSRGKAGALEQANGGTVFLDEIGEMPFNVQAKLLRAMQEQRIQRVGSTNYIRVNPRIIAATNRDLKAMAYDGLFRMDLFYRLNVIPIHIPPLRERRDDIIRYSERILSGLNKAYNDDKHFSKEAYEKLYDYNWPGNIRELKNVIERVFIMCQDTVIEANELPSELGKQIDDKEAQSIRPLKDAVAELEYSMIQKSFDKYKNVREAAKALGIDASTFVRKRQKYSKIVK